MDRYETGIFTSALLFPPTCHQCPLTADVITVGGFPAGDSAHLGQRLCWCLTLYLKQVTEHAPHTSCWVDGKTQRRALSYNVHTPGGPECGLRLGVNEKSHLISVRNRLSPSQLGTTVHFYHIHRTTAIHVGRCYSDSTAWVLTVWCDDQLPNSRVRAHVKNPLQLCQTFDNQPQLSVDKYDTHPLRFFSCNSM